MNMFARFDENPAITVQDIKETKRYGRTDARTDGRTDNVKTVYPPQTKFAGGGIMILTKVKFLVFMFKSSKYDIVFTIIITVCKLK